MRHLLLAVSLLALAGCGPPAESTPSPATPVSAPAPDPALIQARIAALPAPYNEATYEDARYAFGQCNSCHSINPGGRDKQGPSLHGVIGRQAGAVEGFAYSQALQDADFTWDAAHLDHWLENPRTFLPGNRMAFAGVRDETKRRDLIAYLMAASSE